MRQKRKWIVISVLVAVIVLTVGVFGVVSYAETPTTPTPTTTSPVKGLMERVANILGVDKAKLENAFQQAQKEMREEAQNTRLQEMVKQGKLTQEQADKYQAWLKSRPDVPAGMGAPMMRGGPGFKGPMGGFRCFPGVNQAPPSPTASPTATR
jgi:cell shape-determining protein MreC